MVASHFVTLPVFLALLNPMVPPQQQYYSKTSLNRPVHVVFLCE